MAPEEAEEVERGRDAGEPPAVQGGEGEPAQADVPLGARADLVARTLEVLQARVEDADREALRGTVDQPPSPEPERS